MNLANARRRLLLASLLSLHAVPALRADVKLSMIFGDHMVLQQDGAAPVWGTADPGESVTVTAGTVTGSATADADGKWMVKLSGLPVSAQPIEITVQGKNQIVLHDVLVGDVWVCSGQSNMQFGIGKDASAQEEIAKANHPEIRLFMVTQKPLPAPATEMAPPAPHSTEGQWLVCSPSTVKQNGWNGFSAVGYFFGRDIAAYTHQPVGLIGTYWGGTPAQSWTSLEGLQTDPALKEYADQSASHRQNFDRDAVDYQNTVLPKWQADSDKWQTDHKDKWDAYQASLQKYNDDVKAAPAQGTPPPSPATQPQDPSPKKPADPATDPHLASVLYNSMIAPIIPYGIKGAIWYQGESNWDHPVQYGTLLSAMIADWRGRWGQGDFPFLIVQLANYEAKKPDPGEGNWNALREGQSKVAAQPHNGLAVTIDIGEADDVHPKDKDDVSARLALAARKVAYGDASVVSSGPTYSEADIEGSSLRVLFNNVGGGLVIGTPPPHFHPGQPRLDASVLKGFAVSGDDGKYYWADARIEGAAVILSSPRVPAPVTVRYDWAMNPDGNLYNQEGLPAVPFRTDDAPVGEYFPKYPAPATAK